MELDKQTVEEITKTVIKEMHKEQTKHTNRYRDRRLRNTKLLVENYRMLSKHCKGIDADLRIYEELVFDPEQLELHTLMKYKAKTKKMLIYLDSQLTAYREFCKATGPMAERRYKIMYAMFIEEQGRVKDDIATYYNVDRSTMFRDAKKAIEELSIFLFGLDSLYDLNATNLP